MKGLLIKDFRLLLQQKYFLLFMLVAAVVLNFQIGEAFAMGYMTSLCSFFAISSVIYDESENGYPFLLTLPVMREAFVREKYLFAVLCNIGTWFIAVLMSGTSKVISEGRFPEMEFYSGIILVIPFFLVMAAVVFPFQFKFGADRGKFVFLIALGFLFLIGYAVSKACDALGIDWEKMFTSLSALWRGVTELLIFVVSAAIVLVSCAISGKIMKRREF